MRSSTIDLRRIVSGIYLRRYKACGAFRVETDLVDACPERGEIRFSGSTSSRVRRAWSMTLTMCQCSTSSPATWAIGHSRTSTSSRTVSNFPLICEEPQKAGTGPAFSAVSTTSQAFAGVRRAREDCAAHPWAASSGLAALAPIGNPADRSNPGVLVRLPGVSDTKKAGIEPAFLLARPGG